MSSLHADKLTWADPGVDKCACMCVYLGVRGVRGLAEQTWTPAHPERSLCDLTSPIRLDGPAKPVLRTRPARTAELVGEHRHSPEKEPLKPALDMTLHYNSGPEREDEPIAREPCPLKC